jgi:hypothetical protein
MVCARATIPYCKVFSKQAVYYSTGRAVRVLVKLCCLADNEATGAIYTI